MYTFIYYVIFDTKQENSDAIKCFKKKPKFLVLIYYLWVYPLLRLGAFFTNNNELISVLQATYVVYTRIIRKTKNF